MQPRLYPDAGLLPVAHALPLDASFASVGPSAMRETPWTSNLDPSSGRTMATPDRERTNRFAPSVRGLCSALPLSIVLWIAILLVCCG